MKEKNVNSKVPVKKINDVKKLSDKIIKSKTLMIVSIKSLPSKQFQDIKKSIRNDAFIQIAKKNILIRAIKELKKNSILKFEEYIKENCAFAISELDGFELAGLLSQKKTPVFAKTGQIAPMDIEVKEGPTDLVPGPAISELGALGIQISVENGKIAIKSPKVVVKQGNFISEGAASILQKLNIQPFSVGLDPVAIYDVQTEKIYTDIKINPGETTEQLKFAAAKALGLAQKIRYFCRETIVYFLAKADIGAKAIESKIQNSRGGN